MCAPTVTTRRVQYPCHLVTVRISEIIGIYRESEFLYPAERRTNYRLFLSLTTPVEIAFQAAIDLMLRLRNAPHRPHRLNRIWGARSGRWLDAKCPGSPAKVRQIKGCSRVNRDATESRTLILWSMIRPRRSRRCRAFRVLMHRFLMAPKNRSAKMLARKRCPLWCREVPTASFLRHRVPPVVPNASHRRGMTLHQIAPKTRKTKTPELPTRSDVTASIRVIVKRRGGDSRPAVFASRYATRGCDLSLCADWGCDRCVGRGWYRLVGVVWE